MKFIVVLFIAALALNSQVANAQMQLLDYSSAGSGCPAGSVSVVMSPDGSSFSVLYDRMSAQVGPGAPAGVADCEVQFHVKKPLLLGFQVESADFRGFAALDAGVVAEQNVKVATGSIRQVRELSANFGSQQLVGPVSHEYILSTVKPVSLDILACAPPRARDLIVIKTKLHLYQSGNPNGNGMMTVDSADGKMVQTYHLRFQNCAQTITDVIGGIFGGLGGRRPRLF